MNIRRIVPDITASDPAKAHAFYGEALGLELAMNLEWARAYVSASNPTAQVLVARPADPDAPRPDLSIEVDDLDEALARMVAAGFQPEYGPVLEPWGVRRFFVRDPFGKLVNVLCHAPPAL